MCTNIKDTTALEIGGKKSEKVKHGEENLAAESLALLTDKYIYMKKNGIDKRSNYWTTSNLPVYLENIW